MSGAMSEIENEIRALTGAQRLQLLRMLVAELDGPAESNVDRAWMAEAERRNREIESGAVESVSGEEVFRDAAQVLRR